MKQILAAILIFGLSASSSALVVPKEGDVKFLCKVKDDPSDVRQLLINFKTNQARYAYWPYSKIQYQNDEYIFWIGNRLESRQKDVAVFIFSRNTGLLKMTFARAEDSNKFENEFLDKNNISVLFCFKPI